MNIKSLRAKKKISQIELANQIGVDQTAVSQWERGEAMPRAEKLPELAKALECSIDELFDKEGR